MFVYVDHKERRVCLFIRHQSLIDSFPTNLKKKEEASTQMQCIFLN